VHIAGNPRFAGRTLILEPHSLIPFVLWGATGFYYWSRETVGNVRKIARRVPMGLLTKVLEKLFAPLGWYYDRRTAKIAARTGIEFVELSDEERAELQARQIINVQILGRRTTSYTPSSRQRKKTPSV
jgi:hypothetical protein